MRAAVARLEVVARRNPGKAPEIIAIIRKLERVALCVERYATSVGGPAIRVVARPGVDVG
jgi:hypothetical protein